MTGILIACAANCALGVSLVIDKIFLKERKPDAPIAYAFWIGILNIFGLSAAFFGFVFPPFHVVLLALAAGAVFFLALIAYYFALHRGEASQTLAIVGGFAPLATYAASAIILKTSLNIAEGFAFALLTVGGFLLFFTDRPRMKHIVLFVILAAALFGIGNTLEKAVFEQVNFATGFALIKLGTLLAALSLLIVPAWRASIANRSQETPSAHRLRYFANRILAGIASLGIFYAVSFAHPALVEAIGGLRYVIIFLIVFGIFHIKPQWLTERLTAGVVAIKAVATAAIFFGLIVLGIQTYYASRPPPVRVSWGVTFSDIMSERLGLEWRSAYLAVLDELKPAGVRVAAYWSAIQPEQDTWDFGRLDFQVEEAKKRNTPLVIAIGQKTPRWPECHVPQWAARLRDADTKNQTADYQDALLAYLTAVVGRYHAYPHLLYWQVENEPFLIFGECPPVNVPLLDAEIALVRRLDPRHKILATDGGEFGDWYRAAKRADAFGTTLYRKVHSDTFGHITYPLTPEFYPFKADVVRFLMGARDKEIFDIELGMEPWTKKQIHEIPLSEQLRLFTLDDFDANIHYALRTGFSTHYLWGAEWWYLLKTRYDVPAYWQKAILAISGTTPQKNPR